MRSAYEGRSHSSSRLVRDLPPPRHTRIFVFRLLAHQGRNLQVVKQVFVAIILTLIFLAALLPRAHARTLDANGSQVIATRAPDGCPPRRFCGCALRKFLGLADTSLNLAWNWARKFPRTVAQPGAVAVRSHHVMQLISHRDGQYWMVRDYNSGGGLSRIHVRKVTGFVFVSVRSDANGYLAKSSRDQHASRGHEGRHLQATMPRGWRDPGVYGAFADLGTHQAAN